MIARAEHTPQQNFVPFARTEDFLSAAANNNPDLYPGERPEDSYVTDGENVYAVSVATDGEDLQFTVPTEAGEASLDDLLSQQGVAGMADRIPVLAYGANMCPASLASKFRKDVTVTEVEGQQSTENHRPDLGVVPNIYGKLRGHDVVWSGGPGINGNFIAILYAGAETQDTAVQVGVNFLTREQVLMMHATELAYNLSSVDVEIAGQTVKAYYYAGTDSVYLKDGKPVAVQNIPAENRALGEGHTAPLLDDLLADGQTLGDLYEEYPELKTLTTSQEYITYARSLFAARGKGARLAFRKRVHAAVAGHGHSKVVTNELADQALVSWANPSTIPTYGDQLAGIAHHDVYRLPSEELPPEAWRNQAARRRVVRAVGTHLVRVSGGDLSFKEDEKQG